MLKPDKLPFKFTGDSSQSLTYIFPNEKNLILVNSGFPFWEISDKGSPGLRILRNPSKASALFGYGDWVFNDGQKTVSGYFDNNWEMLPKDIENLKSVKGIELRK